MGNENSVAKGSEGDISYNDILESEVVVLSPSYSLRNFHIHAGLLQQKCKVLHHACTSSFEEGEEKHYKFGHPTSEGTLVRFIQWAYALDYQEEIKDCKVVAIPGEIGSEGSQVHTTPDATENHPLLLHGRLYVFADTYDIDSLKVLVLKKVRIKLRSWAQPSDSTRLAHVVDLLKLAFDNLLSGDAMLDFLGKYAAANVVRLRQQPGFEEAAENMGLKMIQYVMPWSGDPFKLADGKYD